ncbi:uncharacterized protein LOC141686381 [Apium graveolens]|uniref:uncharacterized protein LOC141686381 n=1 Tax=Apium graveolens TaxID=4045 RepID=UPI003D7A43A9
MVETDPERKIKVFRTDCGREFNSREFSAYYEENGIVRHLTAPYTPQQNGVVERRNRTVVEMVRSFIKQMQMPTSLWGEAARLTLSGVTPYEALKYEKPNIGHIKVFGCKAYMKVPNSLTKKLDDRCRSVVNSGKEPGIKESKETNMQQNELTVLEMQTPDELIPNDSGGSNSPIVPSQSGTSMISTESSTQDNGSENSTSNFSSPVHSTQSYNQSNEDENVDGSTEPRKYKSINDIYENTEPIELQEEELLLMGVDEPMNYNHAMKKKCWRQAIKVEMDSIERNDTWTLSDLP